MKGPNKKILPVKRQQHKLQHTARNTADATKNNLTSQRRKWESPDLLRLFSFVSFMASQRNKTDHSVNLPGEQFA